MIEQSRKSDELQSILTDLYYATVSLQIDEPNTEDRWPDQYTTVADKRDRLEQASVEQGQKIRALEAQVDQLDDIDIQGLRAHKRELTDLRNRRHDAQIRSETQLASLQEQHGKLLAEQARLLREQAKGAHILAELNVVQDIRNVLQRSYERITKEELAKVSNLMNTYFLEMIGADPEQGALIRRADISEEFDILVYGPNDRKLNPDRDLNGASRRALTLAFILSLTKVSEVEAPNIIDTPLGMMSGYVKSSVLKTAIRESSQLVLLLTRSEIADCEDILDAEAGKVFTLTNPAHYPFILEHEPKETVATVLRCECDHRGQCRTCQRRVDTMAAAN